MKRKFIITLSSIACILGFTIPAANATSANPPNNCNLITSFCNMIDQASTARWAYGTDHNEALIGNTSSDPYNAQGVGGGWYIIINNINGLVWNYSNGRIYSDSYVAGDANEMWDFPLSPNGGQFIENDADGTHWAVQCCASGNYLAMANGYTNGTEYWNWKS